LEVNRCYFVLQPSYSTVIPVFFLPPPAHAERARVRTCARKLINSQLGRLAAGRPVRACVHACVSIAACRRWMEKNTIAHAWRGQRMWIMYDVPFVGPVRRCFGRGRDDLVLARRGEERRGEESWILERTQYSTRVTHLERGRAWASHIFCTCGPCFFTLLASLCVISALCSATVLYCFLLESQCYTYLSVSNSLSF
jgi:hypothetical protein